MSPMAFKAFTSRERVFRVLLAYAAASAGLSCRNSALGTGLLADERSSRSCRCRIFVGEITDAIELVGLFRAGEAFHLQRGDGVGLDPFLERRVGALAQ